MLETVSPRHCRRCARGDARGYILLETVVALTLMAVGLVGVYGALRASVTAARRARDLTTATLLAQGKLALLRALPPASAGIEEGTFDEPFDRYHWCTDIKPVDVANLYRVVLEVWWVERGQRVQIALASLILLQT